MNDLILLTHQTPGIVTFENYEAVKANLEAYAAQFADMDYAVEGIEVAAANRDELKKQLDIVSKTEKALEAEYSAPYKAVAEMLDNLHDILNAPYKTAKDYVDTKEKAQKKEAILDYAAKQAQALGSAGSKIMESPAFFKNDWLKKTCKAKTYQDEIDGIFRQAAADISSIQAAGGENTSMLMAQYYQTLSMAKVKSFLDSLKNEQEADPASAASENNVLGYKVLKITATEDQMAALLDQMELMGLDVEEIEDGMPKAMPELTEPGFNSFVAFDIETTGSNGAANGDGEAKITEIGAVRVVNGEVVEKFDELANPGRKIVPRIARLTHITDEMVADKPPVDEIIRRFHDFVGGMPLVGHNIKASDLRYIVKAANHAGVHFNVPFLDTYLLAKTFKNQQGWEKVSLPYLAEYYGFEHKEVHRAWSDADVNEQVYFELQKLYFER